MKNSIYIAIVVVIIIVGAVYFLSGRPSYTPNEYKGNYKGSMDANVTMVEYSDFQCQYCGAAYPTVKQIVEKYGDSIKFQYRHFPLPAHANAQKAAEASECAADQGKFWDLHDKMFDNQQRLDVGSLKSYASSLGFNTTSFNACLDSGVMASRVSFDKGEGQSAGVSGTPTFFINGKKLVGNQPYSTIENAIEDALKAS